MRHTRKKSNRKYSDNRNNRNRRTNKNRRTNRKRLTKRKPVRKHRTLRRKMRGGADMNGIRNNKEQKALSTIATHLEDEKILFAATMKKYPINSITSMGQKNSFFVLTTNQLLYYDIINVDMPLLEREFLIKNLFTISKSDKEVKVVFIKDKKNQVLRIKILPDNKENIDTFYEHMQIIIAEQGLPAAQALPEAEPATE